MQDGDDVTSYGEQVMGVERCCWLMPTPLVVVSPSGEASIILGLRSLVHWVTGSSSLSGAVITGSHVSASQMMLLMSCLQLQDGDDVTSYGEQVMGVERCCWLMPTPLVVVSPSGEASIILGLRSLVHWVTGSSSLSGAVITGSHVSASQMMPLMSCLQLQDGDDVTSYGEQVMGVERCCWLMPTPLVVVSPSGEASIILGLRSLVHWVTGSSSLSGAVITGSFSLCFSVMSFSLCSSMMSLSTMNINTRFLLLICGDIESNPGPEFDKNKCPCDEDIGRREVNVNYLLCAKCNQKWHLQCAGLDDITEKSVI